MKRLSPLLILLITGWSVLARAELRFVTAQVVEDRLVVTANDDGREVFLRFESTAALDAAARLIANTSAGAAASPMLSDETLHFPSEEEFQKFLRFWTISPRPLTWQKIWGNPQRRQGRVELPLKRAWRLPGDLKAKPSSTAAAVLGCLEEDFRFCLGNTPELSNPTLLAAEDLDPLSADDIEKLRAWSLPSTENLQMVFTSVGLPAVLAEYYAHQLRARREVLLGVNGEDRARLARLTISPWVKNGALVRLPDHVQGDFTLENLETRLNMVIEKSLDTLNSAGQYMLGHFPFMGMEYDLGKGGWMVETGFMYRVKRKIEKNIEAAQPDEAYRVQDVLEVMLTLGLGKKWVNKKIRLSMAAGSGYIRNYSVTSFAASPEEARRKYWMISKELLWTGKDLSALRPGESFRVAHGGLVMVNANASLKVSKLFRPGGYVMPLSSYLWSFQVTRDQQKRFLVSSGNDLNFEIIAKTFWKAINRFIRIPVTGFNVKSSTTSSRTYVFDEGTVTRPDSPWRPVFLDFVRTGDVAALPPNTPSAGVRAEYSSSNRWLYLGLRNSEKRRWQGWIDLKDPQKILSREQGKKYYIIERREALDGKNVFSSTSFHEHCSYWGGLQKDVASQQVEDGSFRFSCRLDSETLRDLPLEAMLRMGRLMALNDDQMRELVSLKSRPPGQIAITLRGSVPWNELRGLVDGSGGEWWKRFEREVESVRQSRDNLSAQDMKQGLERFHLVMALSNALQASHEEDRLRGFFDIMSPSENRDLFLLGFLERLERPALEIRVYIPSEVTMDQGEKVYQRGDFRLSPDFELFQDREKTLNIPW
ncbi:MAG: hypothetical protein KF802_04900 [Bdellovibrionaceae bacterium]|nr:hypothetical protein [Pseudobdellovibrionaceae bacterium]